MQYKSTREHSVILQVKLSGCALTDLKWFVQGCYTSYSFLAAAAWRALFSCFPWAVLSRSQRPLRMLETGRNVRLVKKLNLSNTWGDKATRLTMMRNWWALCFRGLPDMWWSFILLYFPQQPSMIHANLSAIRTPWSILCTPQNSCPLEMNGLLFQFTVVAVFFLFIPLFFFWLYFLLTCFKRMATYLYISSFLLSHSPSKKQKMNESEVPKSHNSNRIKFSVWL